MALSEMNYIEGGGSEGLTEIAQSYQSSGSVTSYTLTDLEVGKVYMLLQWSTLVHQSHIQHSIQ